MQTYQRELPDETVIRLAGWLRELRSWLAVKAVAGDWSKEEESFLRLLGDARRKNALERFSVAVRADLWKQAIHSIKEGPTGLRIELTAQPSRGAFVGIATSVKIYPHSLLTGLNSPEVLVIRDWWRQEYLAFRAEAIEEMAANPEYPRYLGEHCWVSCLAAMRKSLDANPGNRLQAVAELYSAYKDDPRWPTEEGYAIAEVIGTITSVMRVGEDDLHVLERLNDLNLGAGLRRHF